MQAKFQAMKGFALISLICLFSVCNVFSQALRWEMDEEKSYPIPVGQCTWEDIKNSEFSSLVNEYSMNVILDADVTVQLAEVLQSKPDTKYEIEAFFGAWDEESLKQLPHFQAFVFTMEAKYQQPIDYKFYACNREYDCGYDEPKTMPYFRIYRISPNAQRTLIGEILEKPTSSFEKDVLKMIKH